MKIIKILLLITIFVTSLTGCSDQKKHPFKPKKVFESADLIITQISENCFVHTSFKQTQDFGNVTCNGLIVTNNHEAIILDTPTNDKSSEKLIQWVTEKLDCKINAVVPTHFHDDCLGGLGTFHKNNIASYAYFKTITLAKENHFVVPENSFTDSLELKISQQKIVLKFFGEGHTKDNIVGYYPKEHILFGGCLIKALDATQGYLGDANVADWSTTVKKIKEKYPDVSIVIPGHGDYGNAKLLDYTIKLFETH